MLLALVLLNTSAFGAHLHLCFDGQEPRSSLHVGEGQQGLHLADSRQKHNDVDVQLTEQALAKVFKFEVWWGVQPPSWTIPTVSRVASLTGPALIDSVWSSAPPSLLPPFRGPPA